MEELKITDSMKQQLLDAMKWLKFLNIIMTIGVGIVVLIAIAFLFLPSVSAIPSYVLTIFYLILAAIYLYPLLKSYKLVSSTRKAISENSQMSLEIATGCFRSILRFMGIMTIVGICLYVLIIACVAIAGGAALVGLN